MSAGGDFESPILSLDEVAAGKFAALVSRAAVRDLFDAMNLLAAVPDLPRRPRFRLAFVCQAASARLDLRHAPKRAVADEGRVERELLPLLRVEPAGAAIRAGELGRRFSETVMPAVREAMDWSPGERLFLERLLENGEIEPEHLTDDPELRRRVSLQPMLRWKQIRVRDRSRLSEETVPYLV